jgi:hypothetical protein
VITLIAGLRESWEELLERLFIVVSIGRFDLCPQTIPAL